MDNSNMERLWAPDRIGMIRAEKTPGCFLCEKHRDTEDNDKANLVLERGKHCYCLMNLYPYTNGHLLVAPYQHTGDLGDLCPEELTEIMTMVRRWVVLLDKWAHPDGFNMGMNIGRAAGAGVAAHLHWHIVPRWVGDVNFMSSLAGTRVINQSLEGAWEELHALITAENII
ncbi:MAG: HIT domain-containing protein [bacterium]|nr:HIT domain-containing protein [bacterium]